MKGRRIYEKAREADRVLNRGGRRLPLCTLRWKRIFKIAYDGDFAAFSNNLEASGFKHGFGS
jgi:hypothetical protein